MKRSPSSDSPGIALWQNAAAMAAEAHQGQTSPGSSMPYFAHPSRVALLVAVEFGCTDPEILAAAYLHDVYEKTSLTRETVALSMGSTVAGWVEWLSKTKSGEKAAYWERLAKAPWQARLIKMADALDHLNGPLEFQDARLKAARKALYLATGDELAVQRAASALAAAIDRLDPPDD